MIGESIEWLVDSSPVVVIYKVVSVGPVTGSIKTVSTQLDLVSIHKGEAPKQLPASFEAWQVDSSPLRKGNELLVFGWGKQLGQSSSVRYHINLSAPPKQGFTSIAFSKEAELLDSKEKILKTVIDRVKLGNNIVVKQSRNNIFSRQGNGAVRIEVPFGSTAHDALYSGSACYLVVPADKDVFKSMLKKIESKSEWERAEGANCLAAFPNEESIKALEALLNDPAEQFFTQDGQQKTLYPVRIAAAEALKQILATRADQAANTNVGTTKPSARRTEE